MIEYNLTILGLARRKATVKIVEGKEEEYTDIALEDEASELAQILVTVLPAPTFEKLADIIAAHKAKLDARQKVLEGCSKKPALKRFETLDELAKAFTEHFNQEYQHFGMQMTPGRAIEFYVDHLPASRAAEEHELDGDIYRIRGFGYCPSEGTTS